MINFSLFLFNFSDAILRYFRQQNPDLVSHNCEVIHSQFTGIYWDLPQCLGSISVEQDSGLLTQLVEKLDSHADLL